MDVFLREFCLKVRGRRDGEWLNRVHSNESFRNFLIHDGYNVPPAGREHYYGTVFEYLFEKDLEFRNRYFDFVALTESPKEEFVWRWVKGVLTKVRITGQVEQAKSGLDTPAPPPSVVGVGQVLSWRSLFNGPISGNYPWKINEALTKRQLLELVSSQTVSLGKFALLGQGPDYAVTQGRLSVVELINSLPNKSRLLTRPDKKPAGFFA